MADNLSADLLALLESARRSHLDDFDRLALADWLEENASDDAQRDQAAFIRLQLRQRELIVDCESPLYKQMKAEADALEARHGEQWLKRAFPEVRLDLEAARKVLSWDSGLLSASVTHRKDFRILEALGPSPWLEDVDFSVVYDQSWRWWKRLTSPAMAYFTGLRIWLVPLTRTWTAELASCPHLANLTSLDLWDVRLGDSGAAKLAASPYLSNLRTLRLEDNLTSHVGAALANSPSMSKLIGLDLGGNRFGPTAAEALAASPYLSDLEWLDLRKNLLGDAGVKALAGSPLLRNLSHLDLGENGIGDKGARALADSPSLINCSYLNLADNPISLEAQDCLQRAHPDLPILFGPLFATAD